MTATYTMSSLCSWTHQMSAERCISSIIGNARSFKNYSGFVAPTSDVKEWGQASMSTNTKTLYIVEVNHTEANKDQAKVFDKISELLYNGGFDESYNFDDVLKYEVKVSFRDYDNDNTTELEVFNGWSFLQDELVSSVARCIYDHQEYVVNKPNS